MKKYSQEILDKIYELINVPTKIKEIAKFLNLKPYQIAGIMRKNGWKLVKQIDIDIINGKRKCNRCGFDKTLNEINFRKGKKNLNTICRDCEKKYWVNLRKSRAKPKPPTALEIDINNNYKYVLNVIIKKI